MNTMNWLIKREYWEGKGGFFWAPVVMACVAVLFALAASIFGTVMIGDHDISRVPDDVDMAQVKVVAGLATDAMLLTGVTLVSLVLSFVIFFYSLGSLYDDRRDRSILFWKSMPISDTQMVLSKAAWALVLAPVLALCIGLALGVVLSLMGGLFNLIHGMPGASGLLTHSHPFKIVGILLVNLPVQMLWSLPVVGWAMLCSAAAPRFPFLWAVILPIMLWALISFTDIFPGVEIDHLKVFYVLIFRGLLSVAPGSWIPWYAQDPGQINNPEDVASLLSFTPGWEVFAHADIWIGAIVGVAMIVVATRLRRWRDEG